MHDVDLTHVRRYEFARSYMAGKSVLEVGGADGIGSAILAETAAKVTSIDNDPALVTQANERNKHLRNVTAQVGDARKLSFADNTFDAAVAFEVIEHFKEQEDFLSELRRVVKPGGVVLISTPDHDANMKVGLYYPRHEGHGHPRELTFPEFFYLINTYFSRPEFFGQIFYREPSSKTKVLNFIKRMDIFKLRKLIPQKTRDQHNLSARVHRENPEIERLTAPAVQMTTVAVNTKNDLLK